MNNPKTLKQVTQFNFDGADKHSISLCAITFFLNIMSNIPSVGTITTYVALAAGISTFIYNAIRIRKEMKGK